MITTAPIACQQRYTTVRAGQH